MISHEMTHFAEVYLNSGHKYNILGNGFEGEVARMLLHHRRATELRLLYLSHEDESVFSFGTSFT